LGLGLGVGLLGARAGRARFEQIKSVGASLVERWPLQQALDKLKNAVPARLRGRRHVVGTEGVSVVETPTSSLPDPDAVGGQPTDTPMPPPDRSTNHPSGRP